MFDRRSAQDTVCLAVSLGWLLAELYDSKRLPGPPPEDDERPLPSHLPGIGAMTPYEKACALAAHVGADLARLEAALGPGMPTANAHAWLDDLDAKLPARSASAVRVSLRRWERWVADRSDPVQCDQTVIRALRQQGCVWRRLLTGQQAADQLHHPGP
jgi:hypothetical protein